MLCTSCGKDFPKSKIQYSLEGTPYCNQPFECKPEHPNSVENISKRQGAVKMYSESELEQMTFEELEIPEAVKERVIKIATKPQSIRLSKTDIAYYVLKLQMVENLSSISEAVRKCIEIAMQVKPLNDDEEIPTKQPELKPLPVVKPKKQEEPETVVQEVPEQKRFVF